MRIPFHRFFKHALGPFAIILVSFFIICIGDSAFLGPNAAEAQSGQAAIGHSVANQRISEAIAIQNRATKWLMSIPGVVGTGTGIGVNGQPVIRVFTRRAGISGIPQKLDGIPVEMKVTGVFVAYTDPTARFDRPVPIGVSTGHPDITAGTIGCRVTDGVYVYALSNNHVYANQNDANIGDSALQPGPYDGGEDPIDMMGTLYDYQPIDWDVFGVNTIDAAIAISSTSDLDCSTPSDDGYGIPSSVTKPAEIDLRVQKYGRTTGLTHGKISEINVNTMVCYANCNNPWFAKYALFYDQMAIRSVNADAFSLGGDSGSLIVTDDAEKNPVGLLFAGSSTHTLANRIDPVLERFGVTVDNTCTSSNSPPTADFTYTPSGLTVDFTDQSTDSDGSVVGWDWAFGDGSTSTEQNPTCTYAAEGTYTVSLTVTDNEGATDSVSKDVTVSEGSVGITLTTTGYKVKGRQKADLEWSGATTENVDVYRDGSNITVTENDGFYTDNIDKRGPGSYSYQVCEEGTDTCSDETTVTF